MRLEAQVEVQGQNVNLVYVVNGGKAWLRALGETVELKGEELEDQKESLYAEHVQRLVPLLKDKAFTLDPFAALKVKGRDAGGVKVASKGHKDGNLYFDKETGLLAKQERRALDEAKQEVTEETYYSDYKDVSGVKVPMKVAIHHDGKEFVEMEMTEYSF